MNAFAQRRLRNLALTGMSAGILIAINQLYDMSLRDAAFMNGWVLFAGMVFLSLFNLRKKLNVLPLVPAGAWLQMHIYVGGLCSLLFLLHSEFVLPNGTFETILWLLFVVVVVSGFLGLLLSRILPPRMDARGERVIFERIPFLRAQVARQVQELAMRSVQETRASTIADFYVKELAPYLYRPRNFLGNLVGSHRAERRLHVAIQALERYLDERGRAILGEIDALITAKANLDYQYALQLVLKLWLFFHLPLNYSLMLFSVLHIVIVYAFSAGAP